MLAKFLPRNLPSLCFAWLAVIAVGLSPALPANATTIPTVMRRLQRFFPKDNFELKVVGIDQATGELILSNTPFPAGDAHEVLVESLGGATSTPAVNRLYSPGDGTLPVSEDATFLYAIRISGTRRCKLYESFAEAQGDRNPIQFSAAASGKIKIHPATSNWCWNACTQMVLESYGAGQDQNAIADDALYGLRAGHFYDEPNHLTNQRVLFPDVTNYPTLLARYGVGRELDDLGHIKSQFFDVTKQEISDAQIQEEINGGRPLIFQIGWYPQGTSHDRQGGHVFVAYGLSGDTLTIADPWHTSTATLISLAGLHSAGYMSVGVWEAALATGKALDLLFLVDTTSSMSDDIDDVKQNMASIIDKISSEFSNFRIGVAEYRDRPPPDGDGDYGDYVYKADLAFTSNVTAAKNAVNALAVDGGGDTPESVYSALANGLAATGLGGWRSGSTIREIVVIGDAAGHDPETWPGGTNSNTVLATAKNPSLPIHITGIVVGSDPDALVMGQLLAGATGGISLNAETAGDVASSIISAVDQLATNPRSPQGAVASIYPPFSLVEQNPGGMVNAPSRVTLEVDRLNRRARWVHYKTLSLPGDLATATLKTPVPIGVYRWRLGLTFKASTVISPEGDILQRFKAHKSVEADYTEFSRVYAAPLPPSIVSPDADSFEAQDRNVAYTWNCGAGATAYSIEIFGGPRTRRFRVNVPSELRDAPSLQTTIGGHVVGETYRWHIQALNYDVPQPTSGGYVPY